MASAMAIWLHQTSYTQSHRPQGKHHRRCPPSRARMRCSHTACDELIRFGLAFGSRAQEVIPSRGSERRDDLNKDRRHHHRLILFLLSLSCCSAVLLSCCSACKSSEIALLPLPTMLNYLTASILAVALGPAGVLGDPAPSQALPVSDDIPRDWNYQGCWSRGAEITGQASSTWDDMTQESCASFCGVQHYTVAGIAQGQYCHCWKHEGLGPGDLVRVFETECDKPCAGGQVCGSAAEEHLVLILHNDALGAPQLEELSEVCPPKCPRCRPQCPPPRPPTRYPTSWNPLPTTTSPTSSSTVVSTTTSPTSSSTVASSSSGSSSSMSSSSVLVAAYGRPTKR